VRFHPQIHGDIIASGAFHILDELGELIAASLSFAVVAVVLVLLFLPLP